MPKNVSVFFCLLIIVSLVLSCAPAPKKKVIGPSRPPMYEKPVVDNQTPATIEPALVLLKAGIAHLKQNQNQKAEWKFEEAIKLDPDYGPAYYWLARARYRLEQIDDSLKLLKKAEYLLKKSALWTERILSFRDFLLKKT